MITNERQYKITRAEAERFKQTIAEMANLPEQKDLHPRLAQAQREALESQLQTLLSELAEYERLKSSAVAKIEVASVDGLAEGLIKARIAAGLNQKALADRLGIKEQQIQRYEAERYGSASFQRLMDVAGAIGVRIRNEILLPVAPTSFDGLVDKLGQVGLGRNFVLSRLLTSEDAAKATGEVQMENSDALVAKTGAILERIYGWTSANLFGAEALSVPRFAAAEARFKMPARRAQSITGLYAAYANYLAIIVLKASGSLPRHAIPTDPAVVRKAVVDKYRIFCLRTTVEYVWDLGIPVLPLNDQGAFHGACWRYEHRNVIVLKQASKHEARWLFDLLHELFHAAQSPAAASLEVIEGDETSEERRSSDEEIAASQFAGEVVLNGRAEELAQACVRLASGSVERLKKVVPGVAHQSGVDAAALANYLAFRLSWQGINWWGAAANLQQDDSDPWSIVRDIFVRRFSFAIESDLDRELLNRTLQ